VELAKKKINGQASAAIIVNSFAEGEIPIFQYHPIFRGEKAL
jgi:hypothetical protein